jgi:hypothetical protein
MFFSALAIRGSEYAVLQHDLFTHGHAQAFAGWGCGNAAAIIEAECHAEVLLDDTSGNIGSQEASQLFADRRIGILRIEEALAGFSNLFCGAFEICHSNTKITMECLEQNIPDLVIRCGCKGYASFFKNCYD